MLPGVQPGGEVLLPTQWSLRPAGQQLAARRLPRQLALHPDGQYLAVLHAGYGDHEVIIVDLDAGKEQHRLPRARSTQTFYGLTFSPDGKTLFASGGEFEVVHAFAFDDGLLGNRQRDPPSPT